MSEETNSKFETAERAVVKYTGLATRLSVLVLFAIAAYRLAWSDVSIDLSKFDFSDLLALLLALFAVAMSVAFYFKSTDSSNQFYDNIYNFTQKTSEILGRIEERFGEQLRHLDEGYGRIESRVEVMSKTPQEINEKVKETEGKEEEAKQQLNATKQAMRDMMEKLAERAKMQNKEKEEFYQKMAELSEEKDQAQNRIREIEAQRDAMEEQLLMMDKDMRRGVREVRSPVIDAIISHPGLRGLISSHAPLEFIQSRSRGFLENLSKEFLDHLKEDGIVNSEGELTKAGCALLRTALISNRMIPPYKRVEWTPIL